jgi:hypothetical protein
MLIALAALSLFAALRAWTTWRSFHRSVEVRAQAGIGAAEQGAMIKEIQRRSPILDPVPVDAATFQSVFLGLGRIERSVSFVRKDRGTLATVHRSDGGRHTPRWPVAWRFRFDGSGNLRESSADTLLIK